MNPHHRLLQHTSFERAWHAIGAKSSGALLHEELVAAYAEPHRHYHTLQHLTECLETFDAVRRLAQQSAEVEIALWFHDAIYDVKRSDNEEQSAQWARRALEAASVPQETVKRIYALVMVTCHMGLPTSVDQQLLVDIDLSILAAPERRFTEYERQIRAEYSFVPDEIFRHKRREILKSFADRPRLYNTDHFYAAWEPLARANLDRAIS